SVMLFPGIGDAAAVNVNGGLSNSTWEPSLEPMPTVNVDNIKPSKQATGVGFTLPVQWPAAKKPVPGEGTLLPGPLTFPRSAAVNVNTPAVLPTISTRPQSIYPLDPTIRVTGKNTGTGSDTGSIIWQPNGSAVWSYGTSTNTTGAGETTGTTGQSRNNQQ